MFIDALGFNDLVSKATVSGTADKLLQNFFDIHEQGSKNWKAMGASWEYKCFTDNVVFGCPPDPIDSEGDFGSVFTTAGFHQLAMTLAGFFVRGGMTLGPLHMSENIVFGQAILDAYTLETKVADVPRIIIDKATMEEIYPHLKAYGLVIASPHDEAIFVDEDGRFFLNYLDHLIDGASAEDIEFKAFEDHRDLILARIYSATDARVKAKYEWSARYHNHVIDRQVKPLCLNYEELINSEPLKVPGHQNQNCMSLSEYMKTDPSLSLKYAALLS